MKKFFRVFGRVVRFCLFAGKTSKCLYSQLYGEDRNKPAQLTTNQRAAAAPRRATTGINTGLGRPPTHTNSTTLRMKTEMHFETSVSTKAEPHYPAENPKEFKRLL
jgi:hypothetical protein